MINAKQLRADLPKIVKRVKRGERFIVLYRSRPAFRLVPISSFEEQGVALKDDPIYRASAVGRSKDGLTSADHDSVLYG
ncbi:MAG: type II toxin-antitoxin system prevent-host-death family antitoxin [Deltaproteobacteria bacterium]|nr:type II toxin-antitoxin system prevent-host-death family antitoxin [Deltaproteobacteria bacterium]